MKKIIMLWLLCAFSTMVSAQTLTVKSQDGDEPLELAAITSEKPRAYTTTNAKGQADISAFKGSEEISISTIGYKSVVKSYAQIESQAFVVQLETSNLNLDEVVVSATRWKQTSGDVPSKIISISPKEVALQNPQTAADLLKLSGKVYIQKSQQGGGSPMIRGFATNRLLYTVDGVRMNTAIFRGGNIQNVISLDPFATEHTEVMFGPGSVIYGSDAIGGVMSFQTLTPRFSLDEEPLITGKAVTRYASANQEKTAHFDVNVGWEKWALVTSISSFDYDHLRQGSNGPDDYIKPYFVQRQDSVDRVVTLEDPLLQKPSAYSQINLMQKVRFKPNSQWDLQYGFHYSETSPYGRYDRHNRVRNGTARYAEWRYGPQKWLMNNLNITQEKKTPLYDQMTLRLAQQTFEESRIDRSLNSQTRNVKKEEVQAYSANLDFIKETGDKNTLFYGVEYVLNDVKSLGSGEDILTGAVTSAATRYPQATWQSMAIYVNDKYDLSEEFTLQGGLRYNQFILDATFDTTFFPFPFTEADINNGALTGSIGAVYRPTDRWVLSANLSTGFRSPNVDDVGKVFDSEPGAVVVPNPNLDAEYVYNADLSIAKVFDDFMKIDLTGYYTILDNALVRRDFTLNGQDSLVYDGQLSQVQAMQNAAVAKVYGVQAGVEIKLPEGFSISSDFNYQHGEEELDDGSTSTSRHAAPWFGVSRLAYAGKRLNLQVYTEYQGERDHEDLPESEKGKDEIYAADSNGNTYAPGWITLNMKAMYQLTQQIGVSAGLENITDQRYRPYSSGISAAGRNFVLSLRANF